MIPKLDIKGLGPKKCIGAFVRESHKGHTILADFVQFLPDRHLIVSAEIDSRFLQISDVLTCHYDLMKRIIEKYKPS